MTGAWADVAVLGTPPAAAAYGAAAAALLARAHRGAALLLHRADPAAGAGSPVGPATAAAVRLRDRLAASGCPARGAGRLACVALEDEGEAEALARRAAACAGHRPVALVLAGPRDAVAETLASGARRVLVVADARGPLARLALATLPPGTVCVPPPPAVWITVARSGLLVPPALRSVLAPLLERAG